MRVALYTIQTLAFSLEFVSEEGTWVDVERGHYISAQLLAQEEEPAQALQVELEAQS